MRYAAILGSVLAVSLVVGCDDKKETPTPPAPPQPAPQAQKSVTDQAKDAVDQGKQQVTQAVQDAKATGAQAITAAKTEGSKIVDQTKQAATDSQQAVTTKLNQVVAPQAVSTPATSSAVATNFDYKQKIQEATTYLKEHKLDLADKAVVQLEERKTSIPAEYHAKIDSLRKMIDSAKATQNTGLALPKF